MTIVVHTHQPSAVASPDAPACVNDDLLVGDIGAAVAWMQKWPTERMHLWYKRTDPVTGAEGASWGRTYERSEAGYAAMRADLAAAQANANVYFVVNDVIDAVRLQDVNPTTGKQYGKPRNDQIERVVAFHVDLDPDGNEQQSEALARLSEKLVAYQREASKVVSSGGGLGAFWVLQPDARIAVEGDAVKAEQAGLFNLKLAQDLGGDHCHDVSRVMRLPGMVNWPNAKKRQRGRKPALARVLHDSDRCMAVAQFEQAGTTPVPQPTALATGLFSPKGSYDAIAADDPRLSRLEEKWKRLGMEGDAGGAYQGDRSRAVIAFATACVRAELAEDVIAACLMSWKIGEHIRDQKGGAQRALKRTIERAKEFAFDAKLAEMNEKHHVVILGGKTKVLTWDTDEVYEGRPAPMYRSPEDFRSFHDRDSHRVKKQNKKGEWVDAEVPIGTWWWNNSHRRQYDGVTFRPDVDADRVDGKLNLWRGFTVTPEPGSRHEGFLEHLRDNICGGDRECFEYQVNWMARAVQQPHAPGEVACAWRGDRGAGKSFAVEQFGSLFGRHYVTVYQPDHLTGKFNPHLQDCSFLNADECIYAGNPQHEQILKGLVTGRTLRIEPKGVNSFEVPNRLHIILTTNSRHSVPAGDKERRFFALHVGNAKLQDSSYFGGLKEQMEREGGRANLLHFLLTRDLSRFDVRKIPATGELALQKQESRRGVDALIEHACHEGRLPCADSQKPDIAITSGADRGEGFDHYVDTQSAIDLRRLGADKVKGALKRDWGCGHWRESCGRRRAGIQFPPLDELRRAFEAKHGPVEWRASEVQQWEAPGEVLPY